MRSNEAATKGKPRKTQPFFSIPREWAQYLAGYQFEAVSKDGTPKLTKGKKPVIRQIDYLDLMLLGEIKSFARRNKDCFTTADALADAVGMVGQEREICDRMLQLCNLGFVIPRWKHMTERNIYITLAIDDSKIEEFILSRKESILSALSDLQRTPEFMRNKCTFNDYLQEYIQEDIQESTQEDIEEDTQEGTREYTREKVSCASTDPESDPWDKDPWD